MQQVLGEVTNMDHCVPLFQVLRCHGFMGNITHGQVSLLQLHWPCTKNTGYVFLLHGGGIERGGGIREME